MKSNSVFILAFILSATIFSNDVVALKSVPREDTVIFDAYGKMANPLNFNWMVPGTSRSQGMHQAVWEPLFILNYETNQIEPFPLISCRWLIFHHIYLTREQFHYSLLFINFQKL